MSKINAVRFINLNYNNNTIRISDETFQLNGKTTLMSLRNGGGKSVLVQMMMAPFIHKKYRDMQERLFESYFTSAKPTFIMVEWALDGGNGYCLTGMMVRRNQNMEDEAADRLEITNFISEYKTPCVCDIHSLPVVEKADKEIILKGYAASRQLFESYKKNKDLHFSYYDMNNSAQSKQYFDKLVEYRIYYKEWETIIRKINQEESGLSKLFQDSRNEKELLEKWFLYTVENKLNRDKNRMREFQNIIEKYVERYKSNQANMEKRDTIRQFKEDTREIEEKAQAYQKGTMLVKSQENKIASFRNRLYQMEEERLKQKEELQKEIAQYEEQIAHLQYENMSKDIYELKEQEQDHIRNRDMAGIERDTLEKDMDEIERKLHIYQCANQSEQVEEEEREYQYLQYQFEATKRDDEVQEAERVTLAAFLADKYQEQYEQSLEKGNELTEEIDKRKKLIQEKSEQLHALDESIVKLVGSINRYQERVRSFDEKEDAFNRKYEEQFCRNLTREYDAGLLDIKEEAYRKQQEETTRSCLQHKKQKEQYQEQQRSCQRKLEDDDRALIQKDYEKKQLQNQQIVYEEELKDRRIIMQYLNVEEVSLWDTEHILATADKKLTECERIRRELEKEEDALQKEWKKLTSGKILELTEEFEEMLSRMGIHPVYGMDWLKKNGYSKEKNRKLVEAQPFLPYALILSRQEITKLHDKAQVLYTSSPIPLIARESLETGLLAETDSVVELDGISFYVWFNEQLLDEEALRIMIARQEEEIAKKKEQIAIRKQEYEDYLKKRETIRKQAVTMKAYEENRKQQTLTEESMKSLEKAIVEEKQQIEQLTQTIEELTDTIENEKRLIEHYELRAQDFAAYRECYQQYLEQKKELEHQQEELTRQQEQKLMLGKVRESYAEKLRSLENEQQKNEESSKKLGEIQEKYRTVIEQKQELINIERYITNENMVAVEAQYKALTEKISYELKNLEKKVESQKRKINKLKDQLATSLKRYQLTERDIQSVTYQQQEELHLDELLEQRKEQYKEKDRLWNEENTKASVSRNQIQNKKEEMQRLCGYEEPLAKDVIRIIDFQAEINKLSYQKQDVKTSVNKVEEKLQSISENLTSLADYEDFEVTEEITWTENLDEMSVKGLRDFKGSMIRDYRQYTEEENREKEALENALQQLVRQDIYQEDYYRLPIEAMLSLTGQADLVLEQLYTTLQSYESQMEKLAVDLSVIEKEKEKLLELLEDYTKDVHNNLSRIDNNSTITIRNKPVKMLKLQLPDWSQNENLYHIRMSDFLDELTNKGIEILEKNENPQEYFGTRVTTRNLYDTVVGIGNIQIKLYKIEEQREYPIPWAEVARNSGGEGFLSAFVVLSSLLHYMRWDETDIFADMNEGKVLVMDNPFAQTNATHLLKPLMDMAKKTNTQLICLSGLGGNSIYDRFDNIYVLNLVMASLRGDMQYLKGERMKGSDRTETVITSQIEVIGQQRLLF